MPPKPCLMTSEGLEQMIAMVRAGEYPAHEAQALALLSIAASLARIREEGGWLEYICQSLETIASRIRENRK